MQEEIYRRKLGKQVRREVKIGSGNVGINCMKSIKAVGISNKSTELKEKMGLDRVEHGTKDRVWSER